MKRLYKSSAIALAIALLSGEAQAETLMEAMAAAYQSNPDLEAQRAALRATDEGVARALSGYRPTINGQVSITQSDSSSDFFANQDIPALDDDGNPVLDGDGQPVFVARAGDLVNQSDLNGRNDVYQGQLTQPLFRGLRTHNNYRQARSQVDSGRAQLTRVEQQTLLDTVTAFMDVVRDQAVLDLNVNQVQVLSRQLEASRDRFRVGEITRTDVAQSEARLAVAEGARIAAEAALTAAREAYRRAVGNAPGTLVKPDALPDVPESEEAALEIALANNPILIAARHDEAAARYAVSSAKGAILPTLDATANVRKAKGPVNFGDFTADAQSLNYSVGATLTVPLYQSGSEYSDVRRAKHQRSQRMLQIAAAERQVNELVRNGWEQLRAARASIVSNSASVRANEIALEGVRQEAAVGSRTTLDVLDAEQELLDSRVNLVRAERDEFVAGYTLLSAIGHLTARDLGLPVDVYDPAVNYKRTKWRPFGFGTGDR